MIRSLTLIAALVLPVALGAAKIPACPGGRYLLAAGDAGLIFGDQTPTTDAMMVGATTLSTPTCGPTHAKPKGTKKGTVVHATWKNCGSFKKVVATATITDNCATMTGTIKAKKVPARSFTAHLSTGCGDHLVDKGLGEQCEGDGDCNVPGATCVSCACQAPPTTTTTATPPTTTPTPTTTTPTTTTTTSTTVVGLCLDVNDQVTTQACMSTAQCPQDLRQTPNCDPVDHPELCPTFGCCGDGTRDLHEACDKGSANCPVGDLCASDCTSNCRAIGRCTGSGAQCVNAADCPVDQSCCGNTIVDPGETCDDGNTVDGDSCPHGCAIQSCTALPGSTRTFSVGFTPPPGVQVVGIQVLVDYPEGHVVIPGSGQDASVMASIHLASPFGKVSTPNDLDYALLETVVGSSPLAPGRLFGITFDDCNGATAPLPADFSCTVTDASGPTNSIDATTISCAVTSP